MNYLYKKIDFNNIEYVGFDMDGTIYDEFEFIVQPYELISNLFVKKDIVFNSMCNRWLEKGSSYNKIFDETYNKYSHILVNVMSKNDFISSSLDIFRNIEPSLKLTNRSKIILEHCKEKYKIFLITDGNNILQKKKFNSLGLNQYFDDSQVVYTDLYSKEYAKPGIKSLELINIIPSQSIFFGDRDKDKNFALSSKMQFVKVYNMIDIQ